MQETVCGQMQSYQSHVAAQECQTETLQVSTLQQGLSEGGSVGAAHEITQVSNTLYIQTSFKLCNFRGIKPFVCNECGLQFTVKSNWQRHVAEHNGNR